MEAVCEGATGAGADTIGILPGGDPTAANEFVTTPIATGLGDARNTLVVRNGAVVIAIDGSHGTLSEIGYAGVFDRPVAGLETHDFDGVRVVDSPDTAVEFVESAVESEGSLCF